MEVKKKCQGTLKKAEKVPPSRKVVQNFLKEGCFLNLFLNTLCVFSSFLFLFERQSFLSLFFKKLQKLTNSYIKKPLRLIKRQKNGSKEKVPRHYEKGGKRIPSKEIGARYHESRMFFLLFSERLVRFFLFFISF